MPHRRILGGTSRQSHPEPASLRAYTPLPRLRYGDGRVPAPRPSSWGRPKGCPPSWSLPACTGMNPAGVEAVRAAPGRCWPSRVSFPLRGIRSSIFPCLNPSGLADGTRAQPGRAGHQPPVPRGLDRMRRPPCGDFLKPMPPDVVVDLHVRTRGRRAFTCLNCFGKAWTSLAAL